MRILTWNILHGGGRVRMPLLLMAMLDLRPDVVVLTEARRRFAGQLAAALADAGLDHSLHTDPPDGINGVLIVAGTELTRVDRPGVPDCLRHRWLEAEMPDAGIALAGVHLAEASKRTEHAHGWRTVLRAARARRDDPFAIVGDLNAWRTTRGPSRPRSSAAATNLGRLSGLGFADAWTVTNPESVGNTWSDHAGRAYRLDYVMLSAPLASTVRRAQIAHESRASRLSDHAALVVDLDTKTRAATNQSPDSPTK